MKILFGFAQDIGKRKEQQDAFCISEPDHTGKSNLALMAVCDGIGGLPFGKEAAQMTCDSLKKSIMKGKRIQDPHSWLLQAIRDANEELRDFIRSNRTVTECGTTLAAAVIRDDKLCWASAGDSHIYLLSDTGIEQLNEDHTYAKVLDAAAARGKIDKSAALRHPKREALTSHIGVWKLTDISSGKKRVYPGHSVLICSDGLYRSLSEKEIVDARSPDPMAWADRLIEETLLKDRPYQDNVTAVIATFT